MANTDPWDIDPSRPSTTAQDEIATRVSRVAAAQRSRVVSDANGAVPGPEFDPVTKNYIYETVPVPLKRLLGSPVAMSGAYAKGPGGERQIASGWGDPRSSAYDQHVNTSARHQGLDFIAPFGENVYAVADGIVRFVGFQSRQGAVSVAGIHVDDAKEQILDAAGNVVASTAMNNIGFGGVAVWVRHTGDFQGYQSEYYHLSNTHVKNGQSVKEGDLIANIGGTGGYYNWFHKGTHLHFQVAFASGNLRVLVRPTAMVPNYWPGHTDSTNSGQATDIIMPLVSSVAGQTAASRAAGLITAINRATGVQNKGIADIKTDQSNHASRVAQTVDVQRTALDAANSSFSGQAPVVQAPMTFDFVNGTWSDGKVT